jgi:plasmid stabilization system protein ParE
MAGYRLTPQALEDMAGIVVYLHKKVSPRVSESIEKTLWRGCEDLVRLPSLGRLRDDLTSKKLLFYLVAKYFLIFERLDEGVLIHAVIHGTRDVPRILRRRGL